MSNVSVIDSAFNVDVPDLTVGECLAKVNIGRRGRLHSRPLCWKAPLARGLKARGYQDINPENVWEEWLALKAELNETKS